MDVVVFLVPPVEEKPNYFIPLLPPKPTDSYFGGDKNTINNNCGNLFFAICFI